MTVILIACATFVSTLAGGLVALKLRDKLHLILGFSAGAVIGVALFDLLPESMDHGARYFGHSTLTGVVALGFLGYLILDRLVFLHAHARSNDRDHADAGSPARTPSGYVQRGMLGAGSLSIHSFLDGAAIGLGFQVSESVGVIVAVSGEMHSLDVFESTPLFQKLWPKLLKSYALDAANNASDDSAPQHRATWSISRHRRSAIRSAV